MCACGVRWLLNLISLNFVAFVCPSRKEREKRATKKWLENCARIMFILYSNDHAWSLNAEEDIISIRKFRRFVSFEILNLNLYIVIHIFKRIQRRCRIRKKNTWLWQYIYHEYINSNIIDNKIQYQNSFSICLDFKSTKDTMKQSREKRMVLSRLLRFFFYRNK